MIVRKYTVKMKNNIYQVSIWITKLTRSVGLAGLLLASAGSGFASPKTEDIERKDTITVWVDDMRAMGDFNAEDIREDLLREAFYDAARREKWLGDYDFEYNGIDREPNKAAIGLRVLDWSRSRSGMYNFTVAADYWNADGEKTSLGTFHGLRSSIAVFNGRDVGDQFAGSAEDAFRDALRTLKKKTIRS